MNYLRSTIFGFSVVILATMALVLNAGVVQAEEKGEIVHDGEYEYLRAQYGEQWDAEDERVEAMLADIRKQNGGKPPNILYILVDDLGFGEMGIPELNYVRGMQTPNINRLADESLSLMRMYTEPSCTPTRVAMMTGRHPVRTGMGEVKVALVGEGLSKKEVTVAEVLSESGYNTAHVGKWHMGDIEESFPHNQGFDFAAFPVHQQVQLTLMTRDADDSHAMFGFVDESYGQDFTLDKRFKPFGLVTGLEAHKGMMAREVDMKPGEKWTQQKYNEMNERYQRQALEQLRELAGRDEPFFLRYWPLLPLNFVRSDRDEFKSINGGTASESMQQMDGWVGEILAEVDELGISDNTIVVLMGDNGVMLWGMRKILGMNDMIYRGGKGDHLEGGVRVNAFVRWPGVVEADSFAGDIVHVTDLFTTFARIGGATGEIPTDRVIDGIDQTALLLKGEGHGRRDYVYIYEAEVLRSVVKQKFKMHMPAPGQPGAAAPVFDLTRDPREDDPQIGLALWSGASFQDMLKRHLLTKKEYPDFPVGKDKPYSGIENLRPESKETVENFHSWH